MKKIFLLMIGACLYADDEILAESLEKQTTESVVEGVDPVLFNADPLDQARLVVERDTCRNPCPSLGRGPGKHSCFAEFAEQSLPERNLAPLGAGGIQYAREALARAEAALEQAKGTKLEVVAITDEVIPDESVVSIVSEVTSDVEVNEEVNPPVAEEVVPVAEVVDASQPVAEVEPQEVLYLLGDQLVLNTGLVLELAEHDYLELFDVGDALLVLESEEGYSVIHGLTGVEVSCSVLGQVEGKVHFVGKVMNGMVELSNGDLYLTEDDEEGFWTIKTSVLKVVTQEGDMLLDLTSGDSRRVAFLGNLEVLRTLDFIAGSKGHQMEFVTAGNVRWISSDLGSCAFWGEGDEVIVQKFNSVSIASFDPQAPLMLLHNVTRDEFAIAIILTK